MTPRTSADISIAQDLDSEPAAWFEIYRADRVKLTSILFSGEDWRWRFYSGAGFVIAAGNGFPTRAACIAAVDALRARAGTAHVREQARRS